MALDPATAIKIATTVAATAGAASARSRQVQAQEQQLQSTALQEKLAAQERTQLRTEQLDAVLGSQTAAAAARGFSIASPTFTAFQKKSLNAFAQDQFAENFNMRQREEQFELQKQDLIERNRARLFQDIFNATSTLGESINFNPTLNGGGSSDLPGG